MADDEKKPDANEYEAPRGAVSTGTWNDLSYAATAKWLVLRKKEKPAGEIFSVAYVADGTDLDRPVTFVFNGGPGASSAYLHMGAVGPKRVAFPSDGTLPSVPSRLVENDESWLRFPDLVFVDPVGTGFSRLVDKDGQPKKEGDEKKKGDEQDPNEYFGYKRALESLSEFIGRWLSANGRWGSPVFIAGESYGGYRVGKLARTLQEEAGVGLNGAILISPALEFGGLGSGDYDVLAWVDLLPTMTAAAVHHGRSRAVDRGAALESFLPEVEAFATGDYAAFLTQGAAMAPAERERILARLADLVGLPVEFVSRGEGRIPINVFARELRGDERKVVGLYDATITSIAPFPAREPFAGPDPTLSGIGPAYTAAVNRQLRSDIGIETEREYTVLSLEVNQAWKDDDPRHFFLPPEG